MKNICFISNKYPNNIDCNGLVFFQQLVWSIADLNYNCTVICPVGINYNSKNFKIPYKIVEHTNHGNIVTVFFPKFFGFGQSHKIFNISPVKITTYFFTKTIIKTIKREKIKFDCTYGHFLAPAGVSASKVGRYFNVPSFFAYGEATNETINQYGKKNLRKDLKSVSGVIAVSTKNKDVLITDKIIETKKIQVFPNGYRKERFYKIDKKLARDHFGWNLDKFIVGFCGSFDTRKGINRLEKAIDLLDNVFFVCAGKGNLIPTSDKCLFVSAINNDELVYFYNSLDVFVLPTTNEGCCNAIVEAIACGCPIISSNKSFNYDIIDNDNAILVDPMNVQAISNAIKEIYEKKKLQKLLSSGSIKKSKMLELPVRARNIVQFMETRIKQEAHGND